MRRGFTLIEMMAVLVIAAVLAASAAWALAPAHRPMSMDMAIEQVAHADSVCREYARRFDRPTDLQISIDDGELLRVDPQDPAGKQMLMAFDGGVHIEKMRVADGCIWRGQVDIPCSSHGQSPSYALLLAGEHGERQWVVVAGLSGELRRMKEERDVQAMFQSQASAGLDAR